MKRIAGWMMAVVLVPALLFGQEVSPRVNAIDASAHSRIQNPDQPGASPASTQAAGKPFSGKSQAAVSSAQQPTWNPAASATSKWGPLPVKSVVVSAFPGKEKSEDSGDQEKEQAKAVSAARTLPAPAQPASVDAGNVLGLRMRRQAAVGSASTAPASSLQVTPWSRRPLSGSSQRSHSGIRAASVSRFSLRHGFTSRAGQKPAGRRRDRQTD
ncbi:MAG: hypothetical protein JST79_09280 [Acidobacteria bacterium]|nr:hypothetical protein [Acidobacteriota bacterium]